MRRMNSEGGIIDIVNEAIDKGQIEVGGGLPEIEEGDAGKVLMVNENEDGVKWGKAGGNDLKILTLDFNHQKYAITDTVNAPKVKSHEYDVVIVTNYSSNDYEFVFTLYQNSYVANSYPVASSVQNFGYYARLDAYLLYSNNGRTIDITNRSFDRNSYCSTATFVGSAGNPKESGSVNSAMTSKCYDDLKFYYKETNTDQYQAPINWVTIDQVNKFAIGFAEIYDSTGTLVKKYKIVWSDLSHMAWTATVVQ